MSFIGKIGVGRLTIPLAALIIAATITPSLAQDAKIEATLNPVIVTATRTANTLDNTPASVSVVTKDDFEDAQANSVSEVMKKLPNVNFGGSPRVDGEAPTIRGYNGKNITIMVDDARRNYYGGLRSPLVIDPYFISQAEVLRGSASSLYGPGGAGGALSLKTISAKDMLLPDSHFGANARFGYSDADISRHSNASAYGQSGAFEGLVAAGYHEMSRIRQGEGTYLHPNDGNASSGLAKLGMQFGTASLVEFSHQLYQQEKVIPLNPQADVTLPNAPNVSLNKTKQYETILKLTSGKENPLKVSVYQSSLEWPWDEGISPISNPSASTKMITRGGSVQNTTKLDTASVGNHRLTYGVDFYNDKESALSGGVANPVNPDGTQEVGGVFLEDELSLTKALRLIPSVRYDSYKTSLDNGASESTSSNHVSPKVTLSWQVAQPISVYGSYGEAFRAPTLMEYYSEISGTQYFMNFKSNPDLKPEVDKTYEIGVIAKSEGLIASGDTMRLRLSAFDSKATDMISSVTVGSYTRTTPFKGTGFILQSQNIATAKRQGGEVDATYSLSAWKLGLAYSTVRVTDDTTGTGLFSPPDKYVGNIRYQFEPLKLSATWNAMVAAEQEYDATALRRRPGYTVHDLYVSWSPVKDRVRLDFGIENMFDKRYSVYQSSMAYAYTYEAGRNVKAAVSVSF